MGVPLSSRIDASGSKPDLLEVSISEASASASAAFCELAFDSSAAHMRRLSVTHCLAYLAASL